VTSEAHAAVVGDVSHLPPQYVKARTQQASHNPKAGQQPSGLRHSVAERACVPDVDASRMPPKRQGVNGWRDGGGGGPL
jgi:hypothetical protein